MPKVKKEEKVEEVADNLCGYVIVNPDKLERAIHGKMSSEGALVGGVGEDASDEDKIAEYDRLGGLIRTKEGHTVKTGSFYDFKEKKPHKEPQVMLAFRDLKGDEVVIPADAPVPVEVQAAIASKEASDEGSRPKRKSKKDIENEDEE